jgi:multiple sugar transport system permease protein
MTGRRTLRFVAARTLLYLALFCTVVLILGPFLLMVLYSTKTQLDVLDVPPSLTFDWSTIQSNYSDVINARNFARLSLNSIIITFGATFLALVIGVPAAYAFSRFRFRGHRGLAQWILSMRFMPPVAIAIPVYLLMNDLHLLDTYWGLIIPYTGFSLPLVVWLMIGFFDEVPAELDDGALIDGCSRLGTLLRVVLPLTAPGLAATAIFSVIFTWNEFLVGLFIVSTQAAETIPVGAAGLISAERPIQWNVAATVGVITVIPVLFFAFFVQKYITRGFTAGAIK